MTPVSKDWKEDPAPPSPPVAEIIRIGKNRFQVKIIEWPVTFGIWHRFGYERAYKKGQKELKKHIEKETRESKVVRIHAD